MLRGGPCQVPELFRSCLQQVSFCLTSADVMLTNLRRARVQYELTQYPKLLAQLPGTLIELLETALTSSRYALQLQQDNAEVL